MIEHWCPEPLSTRLFSGSYFLSVLLPPSCLPHIDNLSSSLSFSSAWHHHPCFHFGGRSEKPRAAQLPALGRAAWDCGEPAAGRGCHLDPEPVSLPGSVRGLSVKPRGPPPTTTTTTTKRKGKELGKEMGGEERERTW